MGRLHAFRKKTLRSLIAARTQPNFQRDALLRAGALAGAAIMNITTTPVLSKKPQHTSKLTGEAWIQELLIGIFL